MRRSIATLPVLLALFVAGGPDGVEAQQGLDFGFRGGVSVATASVSAQTLDKSNRTGFAGGVFLDYEAGMVGFQVGAEYAQKGVDLDLGDVVHEFDLAYLEIPAVLKLGIPLGVVKPSVFGGVGLGFKTGCDTSGVDCADELKGTDLLGIAGADLALYLGSVSLWADARYHFGFQDVADASDVTSDLKNRNWTLQAGIGFPLGG
jgi:hypothetical protein